MIFQLTGQLLAKNGLFILVDVHGVGYGLYAPTSTLLQMPPVGEQVVLYTSLIVREDAQILYGFYSEPERFLFTELIKVSGFGPKLALSILSHLSVEQFLHIIKLQEVTKLIKIPGIGKKMAQRVMIEMHNNITSKKFIEFFTGCALNNQQTTNAANNIALATNVMQDVQDALVALGYNSQQAILAIRSAEKHLQIEYKSGKISSEVLLKHSLKLLSKAYHD